MKNYKNVSGIFAIDFHNCVCRSKMILHDFTNILSFLKCDNFLFYSIPSYQLHYVFIEFRSCICSILVTIILKQNTSHRITLLDFPLVLTDCHLPSKYILHSSGARYIVYSQWIHSQDHLMCWFLCRFYILVGRVELIWYSTFFVKERQWMLDRYISWESFQKLFLDTGSYLFVVFIVFVVEISHIIIIVYKYYSSLIINAPYLPKYCFNLIFCFPFGYYSARSNKEQRLISFIV